MLQQTILSSDEFEWSKTASKEKIKKIFIDVPIKENGQFDYDVQEKICSRLEKYDAIKSELVNKVKSLDAMQLDF